MEKNDRFERYVAVEKIDGQRWLFRCDCGTERILFRRSLETGKSRSCGCLSRETTATIKATHGQSRGYKPTPEYEAYRSMMARCYRRSNVRFEQYGGRGITVCEQWRGRPEAFFADMGPRPSSDHSLDRIDNEMPYSASNCRWATRKEQARNRSSNIIVEFAGRGVTLIEASEATGIPYATLKARILNYGWSHEKATATPVRPQRQRSTR